MHDEQPTLTFLQKAAMGCIFAAAALAVVYFGIEHQLKEYCRNPAHPAQYGRSFCVIPNTKTPAKPGS